MENKTNETNNQTEKDYGTHTRIPRYLLKRLKKISKDTGKTLFNVSTEIIKAGIEEYYKRTTNGN